METNWYRSPSGRLHTLKTCSGGAPADRMRRVPAPTVRDLILMMNEPGRPGICRCAWNSAQRQMDAATTIADEYSSPHPSWIPHPSSE